MLSALGEIGASTSERLLRAGAELFDTVPEHEIGSYGDYIAYVGEDRILALSRYPYGHRNSSFGTVPRSGRRVQRRRLDGSRCPLIR
jgi:hypothetical protein